jgi:hypothetical protein
VGDRRGGGADGAQRGAVVEIFLAIPFERGLPPRGRVLGEGELRQLLGDVDGLEVGLFGEFVAEADAVVLQPEDDVEDALRAVILLQADAELGVVVANALPLAPWLGPGRVGGGALDRDDVEVPVELGRVGEQEAEPRRGDDRLALADDRIGRMAFAVGRDGHLDAAVGRGRGRARDCRGRLRLDRLVGDRGRGLVLRRGGSGGGEQRYGRRQEIFGNHWIPFSAIKAA